MPANEKLTPTPVFCLYSHLTRRLVRNKDKSRKSMMSGRLASCNELCSSVIVESSTRISCSFPYDFFFLASLSLRSIFPFLCLYFLSIVHIHCCFHSCRHTPIYLLFSPSSYLSFVFTFSCPLIHTHIIFFWLHNIHQD